MADHKVPLILFSGGLDSTYLLHDTLKSKCADVFYVKGVAHAEKQEAELVARKKIIDFLNKQHHRGPWMTGNMVHDSSHPYYERYQTEQKYGQALPWLMAAMDCYDSERHSSVAIGYIESDGVVQHIADMKAAWAALARVSKTGFVPLEFPISYMSKEDIYEALERENPQLLKMIWNCELPTKKNNRFYECKTCPSCETRIGYTAIVEHRRKQRAKSGGETMLKTS